MARPLEQFGPFTKAEVAEAFKAFDLDNNNYVGASELRQVYSSLGEDVTDEEIDEMINMVDGDGDGQVSLSEFSKMIFRYAAMAPDARETETKEHEQGQEEDYSSDESNVEENESSKTMGHVVPTGVAASPHVRASLAPAATPARRSSPGSPNDVTPLAPTPARIAATHPASTPSSPVASGPSSSSTGTPVSPGLGLAKADRRTDLKSSMETLGLSNKHFDLLSQKFERADRDKSGQIDFSEFCALLEMEPSNPVVVRMFALFDNDGSGQIDMREFLVGISSFLDASKDDRIKFAFQLFDEDKSGNISKAELLKILKANYLASSEQQVAKKADAIMRQADKDGDGQISYEEFVSVCKRFPNLLFPVYAASQNLSSLFPG